MSNLIIRRIVMQKKEKTKIIEEILGKYLQEKTLNIKDM